MDRRQDISGIGERVRSAVQDAVESGDFGQINDLVKDTAGAALEEFRYQAGQLQERFGDVRARAEQTAKQYPKRQRAQEIKQLSRQYLNKSSKASGILLAIFGGVGAGTFGVLTGFFLLGLLISRDGASAAAAAFFALVFLVCLIFLKKGCAVQERLKRAERYLQLMRGVRYVGLEDLSFRAGQNVSQIRKDIRRMLKAGIFPEGHMDAEEKLFVLDDESWEQYLTVRKQWEKTQRTASGFREGEARWSASGSSEETRRSMSVSFREKGESKEGCPTPSDDPGPSEEERMEQEGRAYVDRLRQLNTLIPGEAVSSQLYRLDQLLQRIFAVLKEHPEKCSQMRRFMDYYLPTTVKLVESYADFDRAGVNSEQIRTAKTEIEKTMDTIGHAFERLLEDLYQDAAMEASADARVLKTVLAQDGYAEDGFAAAAEKEGKR